MQLYVNRNIWNHFTIRSDKVVHVWWSHSCCWIREILRPSSWSKFTYLVLNSLKEKSKFILKVQIFRTTGFKNCSSIIGRSFCFIKSFCATCNQNKPVGLDSFLLRGVTKISLSLRTACFGSTAFLSTLFILHKVHVYKYFEANTDHAQLIESVLIYITLFNNSTYWKTICVKLSSLVKDFF